MVQFLLKLESYPIHYFDYTDFLLAIIQFFNIFTYCII